MRTKSLYRKQNGNLFRCPCLTLILKIRPNCWINNVRIFSTDHIYDWNSRAAGWIQSQRAYSCIFRSCLWLYVHSTSKIVFYLRLEISICKYRDFFGISLDRTNSLKSEMSRWWILEIVVRPSIRRLFVFYYTSTVQYVFYVAIWSVLQLLTKAFISSFVI
jgi:hypothetical protein